MPAHSVTSRPLLRLLLAVLAAAPCLQLNAQVAPSVYVPDSSAALERFNLAGKLEKAGEWGKAASIYQELLEGQRDRVIASSSDETFPGYISVADRVLEKLSSWPAEGLAVYRGQYQPAADQLLQQATTPEALAPIVQRYLLSRAGNQAAGRLMQKWWDNGEIPAVAQLAQRLASVTPLDSPQRPMLLFQAATAWHLAGHTDRARRLIEQLRHDYPDITGEVAGETVPLAKAFDQLVSASASTRPSESSWPTFGGSPDRASVPAVNGRSDALLYSINIANPNPTATDPNVPNSFVAIPQMRNQILGIFPVFDRGELFFQDGTKLFGVTLDGGMKLPGWPAISIPLGSNPTAGAAVRGLALTDENIYGVLGDPSINNMWGGGGTGYSALFCAQRDSGKLLWRFVPSNSSPAVRSLQLVSPPLVVGDQVFVAARGGRNASFSDVYVVCIQRHTGKLLWSTYVASGPSAGVMMDEMPMPMEPGLPQLSCYAGRVYCLTNIGAVAALDAADGAPTWIRVYPRNTTINANRMWGRMINTGNTPIARIYAASPAIISAGHLFALPVDAQDLLVLDPTDGSLLKRLSRKSLDNIDTLIGILGNQLVVCSDRVATSFDWTAAETGAENQRKSYNWSMNFPGGMLMGRPFLTGDSLFLPTTDRLLRVDTGKWKILQSTPASPATWDTNQGPGNVLVAGEQVVLATTSHVNVYTNLAAATGRLDRDLAANPNSAEPLVRYCELLFAAGQHSGALARLTAAAQVINRQGGPSLDIRDRVFSCGINCANRLASATPPADEKLVTGFLDAAGSTVNAPTQAVQYHLAVATIELRRNNGPASLKQFQTILDDPAQRNVLYRDADQTTRYAGDIARIQIASLLDRFGTALYQATEQTAQGQFTTAQNAHDPAKLLEVARQYPNAAVAPSAMLLAARIQEDNRQYPDAASTLRQLAQAYPRQPDTPLYLESLARVYAAMPGKSIIAAGRLAQGAHDYNDPSTTTPIRLPDGQVIPVGRFSDVARKLRQLAGLGVITPLPDFGLPPAGKPAFGSPQTIPDLQADTILPALSRLPRDFRRVVVATRDNHLSILDNTGKILCHLEPGFPDPFIAHTWLSPDSLLVYTRRHLANIDLTAGKIAWICDLNTLAPLDQLAADDSLPGDLATDANRPGNVPSGALAGNTRIFRGRVFINGRVVMPNPNEAPAEAGDNAAAGGGEIIRRLAPTGRRIILGTSAGRVAALATSTGKLLWQIRPESLSVERLTACDDYCVARLGTADKALLVAIDNDTGRMTFRRTFGTEIIQNLILADDGRLFITLPGRLVCKDLFDLSDRMLFETAVTNGVAFLGQTDPDQLLLQDDRLIATTGNGQLVQMYSTFTGRPITAAGKESSQNQLAQFAPNLRITRTHLIAADPYIYAFSQGAIQAANLQKKESPERLLPADVANLKTLLAGKNHLIALDTPPVANFTPPATTLNLYAFSRSARDSGETGRLDHIYKLPPDLAMTSYQMLEGALYLTTTDNRLVLLPVTKP